ncbi:hypothetical protein [Nocardioides acrostichi]|uniref:Uncharacterized protein n=1 Tax=Nocardioides acrostichi TaxID=2784339 RepID=A0A930YCB6_9ACTN|nr:hypothetical protein [Nocardioides acrostichi]MBF4161319.1 hypothetical protein [Nocardioides acrostichi]
MNDLHDQIDASFGVGPTLPDAAQRVALGRRTQRRRRVAAAAGGLGVAAVLGVTFALTGPGGSTRADDLVATSPASASASPSTSSSPSDAPAGGWEDGEQVRYRDGDLEVRPGVTVVRTIENPYARTAPALSRAYVLEEDGQRSWLIADADDTGDLGYQASVPMPHRTFAEWVDQQAEGENASRFPATMRLADDGSVVPRTGVTVVQRADGVDLALAETGDTTGAAIVTVASKPGRDYFVVWTLRDGTLEVFTAPPGDLVGATFEQCLNYARDGVGPFHLTTSESLPTAGVA